MMRANHLTAEEIIKYMDTSDLSEGYLLWMEEVSEHLLTCSDCQRRLHQVIIVDSICEDGGLEAGLRLLAEEEKIREKIDKETARKRKHVFVMDESEGAACARMTGFPLSEDPDKVKHYSFGIADVKRATGAVRGADTENGASDAGVSAMRPITLELCGPNLIIKIAEEVVKQQIGDSRQRFRVVMEPTNREPLKAEAVRDEAGGCYVAKLELAGLPSRFQIYLEEID